MSLETNQKPGTVKLVQDRMIVSNSSGDGIVKVYKKIGRQYDLVQELEPTEEGLGLKYGTSIYASGNFLVVYESTPESGGYLAGKLYTYEWTGRRYTLRNQIKKTRTSVSEITFGEEYIVDSGKIIASVTYENNTKEFYSFTFVAPTSEEVVVPLLYDVINLFEQSDFDMTGVELDVQPAVAISADASTIVMARTFESDGNAETAEYTKVYIYVFESDEYVEQRVFTSSTGFGTRIDISEFGDTLLISSPNEPNFVNSTFVGNSGNIYVVERVDNIWGSLTKLTHPGPVPNGYFGKDCCISGNGRVVYAYLPDSNEVVRYNKDLNGAWSLVTQRVQVQPVDLDIDNKFSINTMYDGTRFTLGPKIYNFAERVVVTEVQKITDNVTGLGFRIASDGNRVVVSAYNEQTQLGTVYIYQLTGNTYTKITTLTNLALGFGFSVAIKGTDVLVGAPFGGGKVLDPNTPWTPNLSVASVSSVTLNSCGTVYYFNLNIGTTPVHIYSSDSKNGDRFGWSVAFGHDNRFIIGAPYHGAAVEFGPGYATGKVYIYNSFTSYEYTRLTASDGAAYNYFGYSVAMNKDSGYTAVVGSIEKVNNDIKTGQAYVFEAPTGVTYSQTAILLPPDLEEDDKFGYNMSMDGTRVAISAPGKFSGGSLTAGKVYVFDKVNSVYAQVGKVVPTDSEVGDGFGIGVCLEGNRLAIGAPYKITSSMVTGKAYIFDLINNVYVQSNSLLSPNAGESNSVGDEDNFGFNVLLDNGNILVCDPKEDQVSDSAGAIFNLAIGTTNLVTDLTTLGTETIADLNSNLITSTSNFYDDNEFFVGQYGDYIVTMDNGVSLNASNIFVYEKITGTYSKIFTRPTPSGYSSIDMHNDRLVIGIYNEDTNAVTGVSAGRVYVYHKDNGTFAEVSVLESSNGAFGGFINGTETSSNGVYLAGSTRRAPDLFGSVVSIYGDKLAVVSNETIPLNPLLAYDFGNSEWLGAYYRGVGAVYIYQWNSTSWVLQSKVSGPLLANNTNAGQIYNSSADMIVERSIVKLSNVVVTDKNILIGGSDNGGLYSPIVGGITALKALHIFSFGGGDLNSFLDNTTDVCSFDKDDNVVRLLKSDGSIQVNLPNQFKLQSPINQQTITFTKYFVNEYSFFNFLQFTLKRIDAVDSLINDSVYLNGNTFYSADPSFVANFKGMYFNHSNSRDLYNYYELFIDRFEKIGNIESTLTIPSTGTNIHRLIKVNEGLIVQISNNLGGTYSVSFETYLMSLDNILTRASKGGNTSGVYMSSDGNIVTTALLRNTGTDSILNVYIFNYNNSTLSYQLGGFLQQSTQNLDAYANYQLSADGTKIFTIVGEDNLSNSIFQYEFKNNNWNQTKLYSSVAPLVHAGDLALDISNDGTVITAAQSETGGTYVPFSVNVLKDLNEENAEDDGAPLVDFGMQIFGTSEYPYTQKLTSSDTRLFINTFEYIPGSLNSYGKIYVLFWNGTEYITLQEISPVIPEGKNVIFAKNYEIKGTKLLVSSLLLSEDQNVPPEPFVSVYEFVVGQFVLNKTFYSPSLVNEDFGFDIAIDQNRLIIGATDDFSNQNNVYVYEQIDVSQSGSNEELEGGEYTQVRIHLGLPYENIFNENGTVITNNLPDITTPNFIGDGRTLAVDYATQNVVNITLTTKMTIYDIKLGDKIVGRMRIFNKSEPYIEIILYVIGFGYEEGITEAKLRDGLKLNVKYPSPNIKFALNTMPRLHSVNFV